MASTFPKVAAALGVETGLAPAGVRSGPSDPPPPLAEEGGDSERKPKGRLGGPKPTIDKAAKRKAALERSRARALGGKTVRRDGRLHRADGTSAPLAALAAQAGCGEGDLCWEVVASPGRPAARLLHCPRRGEPGHEGANSAAHKRPAGFGEALASIFQGQRQ